MTYTVNMDGGPAVRVDSLVKTYPAPGGEPFNAVDGVSFEVRRGELFGFLGPNGAGKTTTLEIIEYWESWIRRVRRAGKADGMPPEG